MTRPSGKLLDLYSDEVLTEQGTVRIPITGPNAGKLVYHDGVGEQVVAGSTGGTGPGTFQMACGRTTAGPLTSIPFGGTFNEIPNVIYSRETTLLTTNPGSVHSVSKTSWSYGQLGGIENRNWVAVSPGVWELPDGMIIGSLNGIPFSIGGVERGLVNFGMTEELQALFISTYETSNGPDEAMAALDNVPIQLEGDATYLSNPSGGTSTSGFVLNNLLSGAKVKSLSWPASGRPREGGANNTSRGSAVFTHDSGSFSYESGMYFGIGTAVKTFNYSAVISPAPVVIVTGISKLASPGNFAALDNLAPTTTGFDVRTTAVGSSDGFSFLALPTAGFFEVSNARRIL